MPTGAYGSSTWGGVSTSITLDTAVAVSPNTVQVRFSAPPRAGNEFAVGDALNPFSWELTRLDTNDLYTIVSVTRVENTAFRLQTIERLGLPAVQHRLRAIGVRSTMGVLVVPPRYLDFAGIPQVNDGLPADVLRPIDFQASQIGTGNIGSVLSLGPTGDYELTSGIEHEKRLIVQRLITETGAFYHLPNYGAGLSPKARWSDGTLQMKRAEIIREVSKEPTLSNVTCALELNSAGVLKVDVGAVYTRTNTPLRVRFNIQQGVY